MKELGWTLLRAHVVKLSVFQCNGGLTLSKALKVSSGMGIVLPISEGAFVTDRHLTTCRAVVLLWLYLWVTCIRRLIENEAWIAVELCRYLL